MKQLLFISFFCLFISANLYGQDEHSNYRIVYLKDGSVLKGTLTTPSPSVDGVSIQILNGEEIFLSNKLIAKVVKPKSNLQYIGQGRSIKPRGQYFALHANILGNHRIATSGFASNDSRLNLGVHFVAGYKFSEKSALGLGVGLDPYPEEVLLPVFLDYRGVWDQTNASTVAFAYNVMFGYSFHSGLAYQNFQNGNRSGGIMIYPNIGIRIARKKFSNIFLDWGYKLQFSKFEYTNWRWGSGEVRNIERRWYRSLTFRIGWEF